MEPIPAPMWTVGMSADTLDLLTEEPGGYDIIEIMENGDIKVQTKTIKAGKKCTWVNGADWFSPSKSWENCGSGEWGTGTQKVVKSGDDFWPLQAGSKVQFKRTPISSAGKVGTTETRKCEVSGPVNVALKSGNHDAMKVTCKTRRWDGTIDTRTWYWNEEDHQLRYRRTNNQKGMVSDNEKAFEAIES